MRIAIAMMSHEANSFCPRVTTVDDFALLRGAQMLAGWRSASTEISGAMSVLDALPGCEVVPTLGARALSGAPLPREDYESLLKALLAHLGAALPVDGVLLVLHGAMVAEGFADATGHALWAVRELVGEDVPVVGTLDLHANVTHQMVSQATALIGYQTMPHVDMFETGARAARVLVDTIAGRLVPKMALVRLPFLLPPEVTTHTEGPLAAVLDLAHEQEACDGVAHVGVYPVQPWLDIADVASSVVMVADARVDDAGCRVRSIAEYWWSRRDGFVPDLVAPVDAVARALGRESGTVILCDSADATSSGSTGDSTAVLRAVLDAAPRSQTALLNIVDSEAVGKAIEAGVGNSARLYVGGSLAPQYFGPVEVEGRVKTISDGVFRFKGPGKRGVEHHMGRTVVLVRDGLYLVIMERAVSQWDPELYRSVGLEPKDARIVQVKSPRAFRAAYAGIFDEVIVVDAPGAASPRFDRLPWQRLTRPIYPLDEDTVWP